MNPYFVVNPKSANGSTGRRWLEIEAAIRKRFADFAVGITNRPLHATELTREALKRGHDCVVAVGGDGTINEVVNGFFDPHDVAVAPHARLAVIPQGTGGDFRRTLGLESRIAAAIERIAAGNAIPVDVGHLECRADDGEAKVQRYFLNVCSFGVSGEIDRAVNQSSKVLGGKLTFYVASAASLLRYQDRSIRCQIDGRPWETHQVTTLAVANGRYFGGGMKVAPDAELSDGIFHVTIWSGYTLADFIVRGAGLYSGAHAKWTRTKTLTCRELRAESEAPVLIDCDGEQPGRLPCLIRVLPQALPLIR